MVLFLRCVVCACLDFFHFQTNEKIAGVKPSICTCKARLLLHISYVININVREENLKLSTVISCANIN